MGLSDHVFLYCERGTSVALLAEPFNAASNAAFLLAALVALWLLLRRPKQDRSADHYLLIVLVFLIGLGSLAFHLLATQGTELADVIPIDVFMLVYLGFALNRLLGVPPGWTVLTLIGFAAIVGLTMQVKCWGGGIGFPDASVIGARECLNGSLVYVPALGAMAVIGGLLWERGHPAGPLVLWAALIFALSVTFRSLDLALCDAYAIEGHKVGTHFVWHLLNGLVLFLLLRASLEVGTRGSRAIAVLPRPEQ
jgi:Ceramidase